jgi:hypothetical protein
MFQTKFVEKFKTHILYSITFSRKSCCLWDNVENCGRARQATDDNIMWRMRIAWWITKPRIQTHTHNMWYVLPFHGNQLYHRLRLSCLSCLYQYLSNVGAVFTFFCILARWVFYHHRLFHGLLCRSLLILSAIQVLISLYCCHLFVIRCIICSKLNCLFSLSSFTTEHTCTVCNLGLSAYLTENSLS